MNLSRAALLISLLSLAAVAADPPSTDWRRVTELDAGPTAKFKTHDEARAAAATHLNAQEKTLRAYLAAHPGDEHTFEARLRLARLLQIRATFQGADAARAEAARLLDQLDRTAVGPERAEVDFARITFLMRTMKAGDAPQKKQLLAAARAFQIAYPTDRRLPALFAEVSTLFDREPETQRSLIVEAQTQATDPTLKDRLADDLKRLDLLGQPVSLKSAARGGRTLDLLEYRGKIVLLVFFADFSPASTEALARLQKAAPAWPREAVQVVGVSLDSRSEELTALVNRANLAWPIAWDGRGWGGPVVRSFGINRLPTVWLIDREGRLRSLNGLENTADQIHELLKLPPQ